MSAAAFTSPRSRPERATIIEAALERALTDRALSDGQPAAKDPVLRQKLAQQLVDLECLKYHSWHILTSTSKGKDLGFEASMTKLMWSETFRNLSDVYSDVVGPQFQPPHSIRHAVASG